MPHDLCVKQCPYCGGTHVVLRSDGKGTMAHCLRCFMPWEVSANTPANAAWDAPEPVFRSLSAAC